MPIPVVYILKSRATGKIYIGSTSDFARRLEEHSTGKNIATRLLRPFDVIYKEERSTLRDARKREAYLKTGNGRRALQGLIQHSPT